MTSYAQVVPQFILFGGFVFPERVEEKSVKGVVVRRIFYCVPYLLFK